MSLETTTADATGGCSCGHDKSEHPLSFKGGALATQPCTDPACDCKSFEESAAATTSTRLR